VSPGDLVARSVRFGDQAGADRYVAAAAPLPAGTLLSRAVGRGELLPRAALGDGADRTLTEVPVSVRTEQVPATVHVGSRVDVWATAASAAGTLRSTTARPATRVFDGVPVLALPATGTSLGPSATRQVIVGVDADQARRLSTALAVLAGGDVIVTARR
jgi:hypothetical protein